VTAVFDSYVFTDGSAHLVDDGRALELDTLITYYRGIPLSMVHAVEVAVDGVDVPRSEISISPDARTTWFTLDEATTVTTYRWEYGTPLHVRWAPADGVVPTGTHDVTLRLKIRVAYIPIPFGGERTRTVTL
jgi:hypothetical protein